MAMPTTSGLDWVTFGVGFCVIMLFLAVLYLCIWECFCRLQALTNVSEALSRCVSTLSNCGRQLSQLGFQMSGYVLPGSSAGIKVNNDNVRNLTAHPTCVRWVEYDQSGNRLVASVKDGGVGKRNLNISSYQTTVNGVSVKTKIPTFKARLVHPEPGRPCYVLLQVGGLAGRGFRRENITVRSADCHILVRIVHTEFLPKGGSMSLAYDLVYPICFRKTDAKLNSYFSDGMTLNVEIPLWVV